MKLQSEYILHERILFLKQFFIRNFFCEAIEAIPQLSAEQAKKVEELLEEVKENMKLQTLCFKIQNP